MATDPHQAMMVSGPSTTTLYVDLLKSCLTRIDFDEGLMPIIPLTPWKRKAWGYAEKVLSLGNFVVFKQVPVDPATRQEGRDWPGQAETMIGLRRLENLQACIEQVVSDNVPGDLLEAGVWRGGATIFMRAMLEALGDASRQVWVCDSFQGLPKPDPKNTADAGDQHWTQPRLKVSLDEVKRNFDRYRMLDHRVRFLPGWFADTLPSAPIERLAVLRIDGDMYGSTMDVLNPLYPKVSPGGFVIVDDYGIPNCQIAVDEYRATHGITEPIQRIDRTGVFWRIPRE